jgi:NADPH-dependent 2,4-dienoyl-CoA reductase/sulfur reductase-like enzyme
MSGTYELAVIGAGPAGIEAALTAAEAGVNTVLIDDLPQAGGQYYRPLPPAFEPSRHTRTEKEGEFLINLLDGLPLTKLYNALTWGIFKEEAGEGWLVALYGPGATRQVHARTLVLANGAYDTPVAFPGWTLPGVITAGAALTLLKTQRVAPAKRALVTGTGPLLLSVAAHLIEAGVEVVAVCESTRLLMKAIPYGPAILSQWNRLLEGVHYFSTIFQGRTPYRMGWSIVEARGKDQVEEAVIARVDGSGVLIPGAAQTVSVDTVVCGYSLTPNTGLARMIGCDLEYLPRRGGWVPVRDATMRTSLPDVYVVGDGAGIGGAENALLEGRIAGAAVALETGHLSQQKAGEIYGRIKTDLAKQRRYGRMLGDLFSPKPGLISLAREDTIICRCEEITLGEIKAAVADGARTIGEVKMVTRTGMGNCQGRMCERSVAGAIVQALAAEGATPETVGYYSIRPPLHPLPVGFLAESASENSTDVGA